MPAMARAVVRTSSTLNWFLDTPSRAMRATIVSPIDGDQDGLLSAGNRPLENLLENRSLVRKVVVHDRLGSGPPFRDHVHRAIVVAMLVKASVAAWTMRSFLYAVTSSRMLAGALSSARAGLALPALTCAAGFSRPPSVVHWGWSLAERA